MISLENHYELFYGKILLAVSLICILRKVNNLFFSKGQIGTYTDTRVTRKFWGLCNTRQLCAPESFREYWGWSIHAKLKLRRYLQRIRKNENDPFLLINFSVCTAKKVYIYLQTSFVKLNSGWWRFNVIYFLRKNDSE